MRRIVPIALMLCFGVGSLYAQETAVKMTFSGTSENSANNLQQPNSSNDEDSFAGGGTLGSFDVRLVRAIDNSPTISSTCSGPNLLFLAELSGGGVFRFHDGSLLYINLTQGSDCIDLSVPVAHCTLTFQITGGTGRFKTASGTLTMTETVVPVLSDAFGNPVLYGATGDFTGAISGVSDLEGHDDGQAASLLPVRSPKRDQDLMRDQLGWWTDQRTVEG